MTAWERLENEVLDRYDSAFQVECATACAWAGELRVTLTDPDGPSRSMTFYRVGRGCPEEIAEDVLADFKRWRVESDVEPMPVPDWMK